MQMHHTRLSHVRCTHASSYRWQRLSLLTLLTLLCFVAGIPKARAQKITLRFDSLPGMDFNMGTPIPDASKLSDLYLKTSGVSFRSGAGYVAVVNLGTGHAYSGTNGIGGSTDTGLLTYSSAFPITATFYDPHNPSRPGVTDYVAVRADRAGDSANTVSLTAYDVNGNVIATSSKVDTGGEQLVVAAKGIHSVKFSGVDSAGGGVALDDFSFDPVFPANAPWVRVLPLVSNDIAYDPNSGRLYASIPSSAGATGNSIRSIDPFTGQVFPSVFIGSEPGILRVTKDGQYLYVHLDGAGAIRRLKLATQKPDLLFSLGNGLRAEDMEVIPGEPESLVVSRERPGFSPHHEDVVIFDNGVIRPSPRAAGPNRIEVDETGTIMYGYRNEDSGFEFTRWKIGPDGITGLSNKAGVINGYGIEIKYDAGIIYTSSGIAVDPEAYVALGSYANAGTAFPDSRVGRVFFVTQNGSTRTLLVYDMQTFLQVGSFDISSMVGDPRNVIRWGANGLAINTNGGQLWLIQAPNLMSYVGKGFNEDANPDILLQNQKTGAIDCWLMNGELVTDQVNIRPTLDVNKKVVGTGDFNQDGSPDLLVQDQVTGAVECWYMHGTTVSKVQTLQTTFAPQVKVVGVGDFNGDKKPDILTLDQTKGTLSCWLMDGIKVTTRTALKRTLNPAFRVVGAAEMDGDGQTDILFQNLQYGYLVCWKMNGLSFVSSKTISGNIDPAWKAVAIADMSGDGLPDVLLQNQMTGRMECWLYSNLRRVSTLTIRYSLATDWKVVGAE